MDRTPNFEPGSLDQMLSELARFYRSLGYLVEQAYRRVEGLCACGDSACRKNPHFATEKIDPASSHLVMRAEAALSTCDIGILQRASRFGAVPILRHGNTSYLFVSDPQSFPDIFPVLGPARGWIALPPHRSDAPDGKSALPSWISALALRKEDLPQAVDVFGPSVILRVAQLRDLAAHLWEFAGEGAIATRDIVAAAREELFTNADREEVVTFLAACCVGDMITTTDAANWLRTQTGLFSDERSMSESLNKAIAGVILSDGVIITDEMKELLESTAVRLADVDTDINEDLDADADEDWSTPSGEDGNDLDGGVVTGAYQDRQGGSSEDSYRGRTVPSEDFGVRRANLDSSDPINPVDPQGAWAPPRTAATSDASTGGSSLSNEEVSINAEASGALNWADSLERQESLLFNAALALFTPSPSATGPVGRIVQSDLDINEADDHLLPAQAEPDISNADPISQPMSKSSVGADDSALDDLDDIAPEEAVEDTETSSDSETGVDSEVDDMAAIAKMLTEISLPLDWRGALAGRETTVAPVVLVQIFLGMDELKFDEDPLTKLALLDMAVTAIPDGTDDPLTLFPYLWPESGAVMAEFHQHRILVEILAGLLLRFDMACSAGVFMGDPPLVALLAQDAVATVSDLVGDPDLVFWLERHLFNVTTREQLGTRVQAISKIISAVGDDVVGDVSTEHLRSLLGETIND